MEKSKLWHYVNIILTTITCLIILQLSCSCECTDIQRAQDTIIDITPAIKHIQPIAGNQNWYIYTLLALDITSSILAAYYNFKKNTKGK